MEAVGQVEETLAAAGLTVTALRATLFMEELWKHHNRPDILAGTLRLGYAPRGLRATVRERLRSGRMAAMRFAETGLFGGRSIEVATDTKTPVELAASFRSGAGHVGAL